MALSYERVGQELSLSTFKLTGGAYVRTPCGVIGFNFHWSCVPGILNVINFARSMCRARRLGTIVLRQSDLFSLANQVNS